MSIDFAFLLCFAKLENVENCMQKEEERKSTQLNYILAKVKACVRVPTLQTII